MRQTYASARAPSPGTASDQTGAGPCFTAREVCDDQQRERAGFARGVRVARGRTGRLGAAPDAPERGPDVVGRRDVAARRRVSGARPAALGSARAPADRVSLRAAGIAPGARGGLRRLRGFGARRRPAGDRLDARLRDRAAGGDDRAVRDRERGRPTQPGGAARRQRRRRGRAWRRGSPERASAPRVRAHAWRRGAGTRGRPADRPLVARGHHGLVVDLGRRPGDSMVDEQLARAVGDPSLVVGYLVEEGRPRSTSAADRSLSPNRARAAR